MTSASWRSLDDLSVGNSTNPDASNPKVIEFSTWCEGEYCESFRVTPMRAAELLTSIAHVLKRFRTGSSMSSPTRGLPVRSPGAFIRIDSRFSDCHVVVVDLPEGYHSGEEDDPHEGGYSMAYTSRREALDCAVRESRQWLLWAIDNEAHEVGQRAAALVARFLREQRDLSDAI